MDDFKILVVGLDGASFDIVSSLAKEGLLVNFKKLMENGCFGVLHSTNPPISSVAWPSLYTGTNPNKHKMFDFVRFENGSITPHTSSSIQGRALWDAISTAGKKVILLNLPFTFPPYEINGIMVSGFPSPRNKVECYPLKFKSLLESKISGYCVDTSADLLEFRGLDEEKILREASLVAKKRAEAMYYLMENFEWSLFMVVFTILDRAQHLLFGYFDKDGPLYNEEKRRLLIDCYRQMDGILGKTISLLDRNTILVVVSDHGFVPLYKYVAVNNLLVKGGFIKRTRRPKSFTQERVIGLFRKIGMNLRYLDRLLPQKMFSIAQKAIPPSINFHDSIAYSVYASSVFINRKKMKLEEYEKIKRKLTDFLYSVVDEETGENIVEKIDYKDEVFSEDTDIPDLTIVFRRGYQPCVYRATWVNYIDKPPKESGITGIHFGSSAQRGIFFVFGEGLKRTCRVDANIVDVAPTILHIEGIPVPAYMDGRVLKETFEADSLFSKKSIKYEEVQIEKGKKLRELSKREKEDIKERLRALGYLG